MTLTNQAGVYKFTNTLNGKVYVGQAQCIRQRYQAHARLKANTLFGRALKKYGIECFCFEVLEIVEDIAQLNAREQYWMDFCQSYQRHIGYNVCREAGTTRGRVRPREELVGLIAYAKSRVGEKSPRFGKKHSAETRAKIAASRVGRIINPAHLAAMQAARIDTRKSVVQYDLETGKVLGVWKCVGDMEKEIGVSQTSVRNMCNGKPRVKKGRQYYRSHVGGFGWRWASKADSVLA